MKLLLREIRLICFFTLTRLTLCVIGLFLNSNMVPFHKNRVFNMKILRNKCIQYISDKLICRNNIIRRCNISKTNKLIRFEIYCLCTVCWCKEFHEGKLQLNKAAICFRINAIKTEFQQKYRWKMK